MRFTETAISKFKLPEGKSEHIEFDETMPGFGLRIRSGGSREHRTFIAQYKIGTKHRRMTLGTVGKVELENVRRRAKQIFGKVADGKDPANERAVARSEASQTFELVVADFIAFQRTRRKANTLDATERYLNKHWKPLHGLALDSISRAAVSAQLRVIARDSGPVAADRARANLSKFFSWAMGEGLCNANPVIGTNKSADEYKPRERVLTDVEIAAVWKDLPDSDYGRIVRLLMLTGCRRDEIGSLRWSEIDVKGMTITLPGSRTKNGREHVVPLSGEALAILKDTPRRGDRDLVFGDGVGGFSGWSAAKNRFDAKVQIAAWTLHDLRRTAATRMADSGIQPHIIEATLNHVSGHKGGVAGIYNRAAYEPEKREALDTLASYVMTAVAKAKGANVTRLKSNKRS